MVSEQRLAIAVEGRGSVSALRTTPASATATLVLYAPGAGSNLDDSFGAFLAARLAEAGIASLRFQFPYMEAHRGGPDRPPVLEATWRAALDAVEAPGHGLIASGRSMGGRIASQVVAAGAPVAGLALFAYPLHPPNRPDAMRSAHLASISAPTLFCSGSRDPYATPAELAAAAALVPNATVHVLDGADHGFSVLKASGRTRPDVWQEAVEALLAFLSQL